jgi:hypothetical protein
MSLHKTVKVKNMVAIGATNQITLGNSIISSVAGSVFTLTLPTATDTLAALALAQTLTNKTMTGATNVLTASLLKSATTEVSVAAATAPTAGQALIATSSTTATWQTMAALLDSTFAVNNSVDQTKQFKISATAATTATSTTLAVSQTANRVLTLPDVTDTLSAVAATQTLTNKTMTGATNVLTATLLKSATTEVGIAAATAPTTGQALVATSGTAATWQTLASSFLDGVFAVNNTADATKQLKINAAAATTATSTTLAVSQTANRVLTLPDATDTLAAVALAQTFTNKTMTGATNVLTAALLKSATSEVGVAAAAAPTAGQALIATSSTAATWQTLATTFLDGVFAVNNSVDATKQIKFSATGATTATSTTLAVSQTANRVLTLPNATDTLAAVALAQTFTNKTMTGATNVLTASLLKSATTEVSVAAATAPSAGQALMATSSTTATWQTPATTFLDGTFAINDTTDPTMQIKFNAAGTTATSTTLSTSQTANRVITLPDATDTLAALAATQTLSNKTLLNPLVGGTTSAAAWGLNGIQSSFLGVTYTDTTSTGAVLATVLNSYLPATIAASAATTYGNAATVFIETPPAAGTNVTITNPYSLLIGSGTFGCNADVSLLNQAGSGVRQIIFNLASGGSTGARITSDTGDFIWQGQPGACLQMGSYHGISLQGGRVSTSNLPFVAGTSAAFNTQILNTNDSVCLRLVPLAAGAADQLQIQNSAGTTQSLFNYAGYLGIGTTTAAAKIHVAGAASAAAWTSNGIQSRFDAATYTDTTSSGTVAMTTIHGWAAPTLAASTATVYTAASNLYIAPPVAGTNVTITAPWSVYSSGNVYIGGSIGLQSTGTTGITTLTSTNTSAQTIAFPNNSGTLMTYIQYAIVSYVVTAGTNGGTTVTGAFTTRPLNTVLTNFAVTVASNQFTIPIAGTFHCWGWSTFASPGSGTMVIQTRIQNITASTTVINGQSTQGASASGSQAPHFDGIITTTGSTVFALQYRVGTAVTNTGLGVPTGYGSETYAAINIHRIDQ